MKIKKLEICGFKSFVDRTAIHFDHDITGIVGPNGCGKSNIVDAIKWVMGEQAASQLRGKGMADVIFNGSESRPPHGFAEVAITFDNADGLAPPEYRDYAEIRVSRRLDRDGKSEYTINKAQVRLLDITNLFLGTGVGKRAYSIIEQGRIGFIVSSKPEDRRHIIEEAAGVTKFKVRKKAAERKMDRTRENLTRVNDILREIERNLDSLKRQAAKAERYKRYRAEHRDLELYMSTHRYLEIIAELRYVQGAFVQAQEELEAKRTELDSRDASVESNRQEASEAEESVRVLQETAHRIDSRIRDLEADAGRGLERLRALRERSQTAEREIYECEKQGRGLEDERAEVEESYAELEEHRVHAAEALAETEETTRRHREEVQSCESRAVEARSAMQHVETECARSEAALSGFVRREEESAAREAGLREELESIAGAMDEGASTAEEYAAELEGLQGEEESAREQLLECEEQLGNFRDALRESDGALETARSAVTDTRSRLRSLEELRDRFEGVGDGVRDLMTSYASDGAARADKGIAGIVADFVDCPEELTPALASVLGEGLQHVVVSDWSHAVSALRHLRAEQGGRADLVVSSVLASAEGDGGSSSLASGLAEADRLFANAPGVGGKLQDLVRAVPGHEAFVRAMLSGVYLVDELDVAASLLASASESYGLGREQESASLREALTKVTFVTRHGEVLDGSGRARGGVSGGNETHLLDLRRQVDELGSKVTVLETELQACVEAHEGRRTGLRETQGRIEELRSRTHEFEVRRVAAQGALAKEQQRVEQQRFRKAQIERNLEELLQARESSRAEEGEAQEAIEALREARVQRAEELQEAESQLEAAREGFESANQMHAETRVRAAEATERAETLRGALSRISRSLEELSSRAERLQSDQVQGESEQIELMARMWQGKINLFEALEQAGVAHSALEEGTQRYEEVRHALSALEEGIRDIRGGVDAASKQVTEFDMRVRELQMSMAHLVEQTESQHRVRIEEVLCDHHHKDHPGEEVRARADELQRLIDRMGEINLTAIEEYEEKSERFNFLSTQKQDLEDALAQLETAIAQMNKESKKRFRETFDAVNERFKAIYPRMFGGGRAELKLTQPDDMLETGVDIIAQPPGKRLGSLELMSGGEKALTAVSLIFAIFQYKPSPFCLLDEVDAPLDEANIGRFSDAVRMMTGHSQFILITHSKRTMEAADVLCGITMEQPGVSKLVSVELREQEERAVA